MKKIIKMSALILALVLVCGAAALAASAPEFIYFEDENGVIVQFDVEKFLEDDDSDLDAAFGNWLADAIGDGRVYIGFADTSGEVKKVVYDSAKTLDTLETTGTAANFTGKTVYEVVEARSEGLYLKEQGSTTDEYFVVTAPGEAINEADPAYEPGAPKGPTITAKRGLYSASEANIVTITTDGTFDEIAAANKENWTVEGVVGVTVDSADVVDGKVVLTLTDTGGKGGTLTITAAAAVIVDAEVGASTTLEWKMLSYFYSIEEAPSQSDRHLIKVYAGLAKDDVKQVETGGTSARIDIVNHNGTYENTYYALVSSTSRETLDSTTLDANKKVAPTSTYGYYLPLKVNVDTYELFIAPATEVPGGTIANWDTSAFIYLQSMSDN